MQIIRLYRYERPEGGFTVSPVMPDSEYTITYRVVADEGMVLECGESQTSCVDTDDPSQWFEVPEPVVEELIEDEELIDEEQGEDINFEEEFNPEEDFVDDFEMETDTEE